MAVFDFIVRLFGFGIVGGFIGLIVGLLINHLNPPSATAAKTTADQKKKTPAASADQQKMQLLTSCVSIGSNAAFSLGFLYLIGMKASFYFAAPLLVVVGYLSYVKFFVKKNTA